MINAKQRNENSIVHLKLVCDRAKRLARIGRRGSLSYYVACGRTDAYWGTGLKCWDIAAGFLILAESGGTLDCIEGGQGPEDVVFEKPKFCASATETLGAQLREFLVL